MKTKLVSGMPSEMISTIFNNESELIQKICNQVVVNGDDVQDINIVTGLDRHILYVNLGLLPLGTITTELDLDRQVITTVFNAINL